MGLNSFDHMVSALTTHAAALSVKPRLTVETNPQKIKITIEEYNLFLKDLVFEKLKGKSLSESFIERFSVQDFVLNISLTDKLVDEYIRKYYIK